MTPTRTNRPHGAIRATPELRRPQCSLNPALPTALARGIVSRFSRAKWFCPSVKDFCFVVGDKVLFT